MDNRNFPINFKTDKVISEKLFFNTFVYIIKDVLINIFILDTVYHEYGRKF